MKQIIEWKAEYDTGVEKIDRQHRRLITSINQLTGMIGGVVHQQELEEVLDDLFDYFEYHFSAEENLLRDHPEIARHRRQHAEFVAEIRRLDKKFLASDSVVLASEMLGFLSTWLLSHVLGTDKIFLAGYRENRPPQ